jgi:hypothetical protein
MLTLEEFKELLNYRRETAEFTWKKPRQNVKVGDIAGCVNKVKGYHYIGIKGRNYYAHRLVWLFETGDWPKGQIDHINNDKLDNRIENLRDVSNRENQQNQKSHRNGRLVGCYYHKQKNKWHAEIRINGEKVSLGLYLTESEAHTAYRDTHFEWFGHHPLTA